jgi:hypothetical protein
MLGPEKTDFMLLLGSNNTNLKRTDVVQQIWNMGPDYIDQYSKGVKKYLTGSCQTQNLKNPLADAKRSSSSL